MDQLKELLAKLGKHGFWIACGMVTVISLAVWWMATGSLIEQYEAEASKLDAAVTAISGIRSDLPTHPNDASHALMEDLVVDQREEVLEAWRMQYKDQQAILVWPERLGTEFISEFAPLVPIELNFPEFPVPEEQEKETTLRERYRDYIKDQMVPLAEKAGAEWKADFDASRSGMGGFGQDPTSTYGTGMEDGGGAGYTTPGGSRMGMPGGDRRLTQKKPPLVEWSTQSQEELLTDLFPWRGEIPSTLEVLYSQENLWVLDQLLQIIADTNGDATQRFQAKIREIQAIGIGRSARRARGVISPVGGARSGTGGPGEMGMGMGGDAMGGDIDNPMGGMDDYMMGGGGEYAMGEPGMEEAVKRDPAEGRYVDGEYETIEAQRVRDAMVSNSPEDASLAVAKRIPVKLRLKMDQRAIPTLLANCGNASLMVEVRQIRIDPTSTGGARGGFGGSGGAGYSSPTTDYEGDTGDPSAMMTGGAGGYGGMGGQSVRPSFPMDIVVEVYGIIYLFNPPAAERLGIEQVTEDTVIDGKSMAEEAVDEGVRPAPISGEVNDPVEPEETAAPPTDPAATPPADPSASPTDPAGAGTGNGPGAPVTPATPPVDPAAAGSAPTAPGAGPPPVTDSAAPATP